MARRGVQFQPNGYYHVYNRGANREPIFRDRRNYEFLLSRMGKFATAHQIVVVAYCLLPNHYHFLLRQQAETSVSAFVQAVFNSYSKAFNKAYSRTGTLFEGPFKARPVKHYSHLLTLCLYIHHNPVAAGLVTEAGDWPHSNYLAFVRQESDMLHDRKIIQDNFPIPGEYEQLIGSYRPFK